MIGTPPTKHWNCSQFDFTSGPGRACMRSPARRPRMQNGVTTAIASRNEARGFYGTIARHAEPEQAWALALAGITKSTGRCDQAVRDFLDSRYGRHFADEVAIGLCGGRDRPRAIDEAIERWMDRRIDAAIERELGIPKGLPYLTGLVCMQEALLEGAA